MVLNSPPETITFDMKEIDESVVKCDISEVSVLFSAMHFQGVILIFPFPFLLTWFKVSRIVDQSRL